MSVAGGEIADGAPLPGQRPDRGARRRSAAACRRRRRSARSPRATSRSGTTRIPRRPQRRSGRRRCALVGTGRPRGRRDGRDDHAARAGLGVDQHRRREGLPRRGRSGPEGARRASSTPSSSAFPTSGGASASSPSCSRGPAPTPTLEEAAGRMRAAHSRATRSRATLVVGRHDRRGPRRGSPTTAGPAPRRGDGLSA